MPPHLSKFQVFAIWIILIAALSWVFSGVLNRQNNPNSELEIVNKHDGGFEIVLKHKMSTVRYKGKERCKFETVTLILSVVCNKLEAFLCFDEYFFPIILRSISVN